MRASPKFCIYGAGAIGGMIGTLLARAGATVSVVARSETRAAVKRDGLQLIIDGETLQARVQASADPAELGPQDYLIIAVKAPNLPDVASHISPLLGPETAVVTAMNGVPWWFFANAQGALAGKRLTAVDPDGSIGRAIPAARAIGCVIYTCKPSEEGLEQAFNSLDGQREVCEAFIASQKHEGWVALPTLYDDGGISGGTMDRPALQRLLADITAGTIDAVVVYKVGRMTRSLGDFAKIVEVFDRCRVSFVSVTQQFNTTTSMGRLTLNMLLTFAQFEREVTGERIRDRIAASKKKGMWMGGLPPLGYDAQDRKLVVNEAEAETVRHIFQRYSRLRSVRAL